MIIPNVVDRNKLLMVSLRSMSLLLLFLFAILSCSSHKKYPSGLHIEFLPHPDDAKKKIEVFWMKPEGEGPYPVIILLHGHQIGFRPGGEVFVSWGELDKFSKQGFVAVSVSQPGYGNSGGSPDFCGPFTQHAVAEVVRHFRKQSFVIHNKIAIEGISRGAVVACMVATQDEKLAALVLISGEYDFTNYDFKNNLELDHALHEETDGSNKAMEERSALLYAEKIKAPTLIMNGAKDDRTNPEHARMLAQKIRQNGFFARVILYPNLGHNIPYRDRVKDINPFLQKYLAGFRDTTAR